MMHLEVLTDNARGILPYLKIPSNFYLAGGTAIALQIGHRISVDYDFFSEKKIPKNLLSLVKQKLPKNSKINVTVNNSDELTFFVNNTKLTFLYYPFPLIHEIVNLEGLRMMSLLELAATKAYTIGRRGEGKDYIDIYYLLKDDHVSLKDIVKIARRKYASDFNDRLFLEQLLYLDDIHLTNVVLLRDKKISKKHLEQFLKAKISEIDV